MKNILSGIWILNTGGLCLLHRNYDKGEQVDETIFGGFLTAILSFTQDLVKDQIESITMSSMEIYYQSWGDFAIAVSVKKSKKTKKVIPGLITIVGDTFNKDYLDEVKKDVLSTRDFEPFGVIIDNIFEIKGEEVQGDSEIFLDILKGVKDGSISEAVAIKQLLEVYEGLEDKTKRFMAASMKDVEKIFNKSPLLTKEQKKQFQDIIKNVSAQMKAENWLSSF